MSDYNTNWESFTCYCPDWQKRRSHYDDLDPRRLCKHLVEDFYELGSGSEEEDREDLFYELRQFIEQFLMEEEEDLYDDEEDWDDDENDDWDEQVTYKGFPLGQLCKTNAGIVVVNPEQKWTYVIDSCRPYLYCYEQDRWAFKEEMPANIHSIYKELIGMAYQGHSIEGVLETNIPS